MVLGIVECSGHDIYLGDRPMVEAIRQLVTDVRNPDTALDRRRPSVSSC